MFNFLHTFNPSPILAAIGPIHIYWYGFFIMLGALAALAIAIYLAKLHGIKSETIIDLAVWLIVGGLIGARLYDIFLEWPYFSTHLLDSLKVWQGGLAIHGAIVGGALTLWLFTKKYGQNFWQLAAIAVTALPLGQAIGRWGNYFNQELFGYPTNLPWGIPINLLNRPWQYLNYTFFHPVFLYESIGDFTIFILLILLFKLTRMETNSKFSIFPEAMFGTSNFQFSIITYLFLYSILRFFTEFIRLDTTPIVLGLRFPQLISLIIIFFCLGYFIWLKIREKSAIE